MRKGVLIIVSLALLLLVLTFFYKSFTDDNFFNKLTGKQIFSDDKFVQDVSSFKPSKAPSVSLSPIDCEVRNISFDSYSSNINGNVNVLVEGENCNNAAIEIEIFEDDIFFDEALIKIRGNFVNNNATLIWEIKNETYSHLFDEIFEGKRLEFYAQSNISNIVTKSYLIYVFGQEEVLLQPTTIQHIGRRCTTAVWIDEDCDGYVIGGKNPTPLLHVSLQLPQPMTLDADANDNDPTLNTPQSVSQRYGDFTNINNFKTYLNDLGYTHQINNIYFISLNGNNANGAPNDINRPYLDMPRGRYGGPSLIQPGDVVVYRGGVWPAGTLSTESHQAWAAGIGTYSVGLQGTETQPILLINYPGERVIFQGTSGGNVFSPTKDTKYTILDGFELDGSDPVSGELSSNEVVRFTSPGEHLTIRHFEVRNAQRWGFFGATITDRDYFTIEKSVVHRIGSEHCLYRNDALSGTDVDIGWVIRGNVFYGCGGHAVHWRGGTDFIIENNIFHSTGWNGIEIKNSARNGIVRNNLIFSNGHAPFVLFEDNDAQNSLDGTDNILVTNNVFIAKTGLNGVSSDSSAYPAVQITHSGGRHASGIRINRNIKFYNNIFYTVANSPFYFDYAPDIAETTIQKNVFYRLGAGSPNDQAGMVVCGATDGTHNSEGYNCPVGDFRTYIWNFESMQDPVRRPQINSNILMDPLFVDVNNDYVTQFTPWRFNPRPTSNSPSVDFSIPQYATPFDILGNSRYGILPDSGAYEYTGVAGGPVLTEIWPTNSIINNVPNTIHFLGRNFNPNAVPERCANGNCVDLIGAQFVGPQEMIFTFDIGTVPGSYTISIRNPDNVRSNYLPFTISSLSLPSAPTGLQGNVLSSSSVSLSWVDRSNNEDRFIVEYKTSFSNSWSVANGGNNLPSGTTSFTVNNLNSGVSYDFRVFAENSAGRSLPTNTLQLTTFSANAPFITSLSPNPLVNDIMRDLSIIGTNFNPIEIWANGLLIPRELWSIVNLVIHVNVVAGIIPGDYSITVKNADNSISNAKILRINYPFYYVMILSNSAVIMQPHSSFDLQVNLESLNYMTHEPVTLSVLSSPEISAGFIGGNSCTPNTSCSLTISVNVNEVSSGVQEHYVDIIGTSQTTSVSQTERFNIAICGNSVCEGNLGEICSNCAVDCGTCSTSSSGSSSSGSSSSGGSRPMIPQCNDKKDNDDDGKIDYPLDLGCDSKVDNSELRIEDIVTVGNKTLGENKTEIIHEETPIEEDVEIRVVYILVLSILILGIIIVTLMLIRHIRRQMAYRNLAFSIK